MISGISVSSVRPFPPSVKSLPGKIPAGAEKSAGTAGQLSKEEKAQVDKLKKIDREVKAHEQAHKNAGGRFAGAASFGFVVGPDGRRYAVSGEVPIDVSPIKNDPAATVAKMAVVVAAALAPAKPSGQDRRVAAQASALGLEARSELAQKSRADLLGKNDIRNNQSPQNQSPQNQSPQNQSLQDKKSANLVLGAVSARAAYNVGISAGNLGKISGNILNIIG